MTSLYNTFGQAYSFSGDLSRWDVSNVESLSWTFYDATSFNSDLSAWNTSRVTDMSYTFLGAVSFEGKGVSNFNLSSAKDIHGAFYLCSMFDADLSSWETGNVVDMSELFYGASRFRGLGVSTWDVSKVTLMNDMVRPFRWEAATLCVNVRRDGSNFSCRFPIAVWTGDDVQRGLVPVGCG